MQIFFHTLILAYFLNYSGAYSRLEGEAVLLNIYGYLIGIFCIVVTYLATKVDFARRAETECNVKI